MTLLFSIILLFCQTLCAETKVSHDEALCLRRITEFYEEKEYVIVFQQGEDFLKKFPDSIYADEVRVLLGDLSVEKQKYTSALTFYTKIKDEEKKESVFFNVLECYFQRKDFNRIVDSCRQLLESNKSLDKKREEQVYNIYGLSLFEMMQSEDSNKYEINEAISVFEKLKGTSYDLVAKEHLAYLYAEKKLFSKAVELYFELASKITEKKEEYLFSAAENARKYDSDLAIRTYGQVCYLEGERAKDAALNRLLLFFEKKKYSDIILAKENLSALISEEKKPLFHYIVGRSYFALDDYKRSKESFFTYLGQDKDQSLRYESYLYLLGSAQKGKDVELMDDLVLRLEKEYSDDKIYGQTLFARAILQKENKNYLSAEKDFSLLIEKKLLAEKDKDILFEWGHMYIETMKYDKGRNVFNQYVKAFPKENQAPLAWHYLVFCSLKESEKEALVETEKKLAFEEDLKNVLQTNISKNERAEYIFLLAKTRFQLKKYELAIKNLQYFVKEFPDYENAPMAYLLLSYSYRDRDQDLLQFTKYAEKALSYSYDFENKEDIHLSLYNAYYNLLGVKNLSFDSKEKTAEHLHALYCLNADKVSENNLLWLATFYHGKVKGETVNEDYLKKGISLFEKVLKDVTNRPFTEKDLYLEPHFLRLAELYNLDGKKDQQVALLSKLCEIYEDQTNLNWAFRNKTYYHLASAYREDDKEKALALFEKVGKSPFKRSTIVSLSLLEGAKLRKEMDKGLDSEDPSLLDLVVHLKNLSLQRSLDTEPVHLEASLELIDLMVYKEENQNTKEQRMLELLAQMKKRCYSESDMVGKDYHVLRKKLAKKNDLFLTYMKYLDVRMLQLQASFCNEDEKKELVKEANRLLKELDEKKGLDPYLKARIESLKI